MFFSYLIIGLGGALGAMYRSWLCTLLPTTIFSIPAPILCINILGCFIMGFLHTIIPCNQSLRYFLLTGFLGGFTTFSSFTLEYGTLWNAQEYYSAAIYTILSVSLSLIFFFIGSKLAHFF